jgi:hypothetical protein
MFNTFYDFLRGLISFTGVNVRRENLITALSARWHSSGYALSSPAGRPTSLTTNPSISTPRKTKFFPFLDCKRSTNPIWRFTPVFGQLASCNGKTKLVVVDNGEAGRKSDGWSMNLKRAAREGQSSAEAGVWRWARCSDICARGVRQLKLRVADLDWWRSVSPRDLKRCPSLQRPTWRSCWPGDAGSE